MTDVVLFSYGTLQLPEVQRATFGRLLDGRPDQLPDHELGQLRITDPHVLATSGEPLHPIVRPSRGGSVPGTAFHISHEELLAADTYEVDDYVRVEVTLASGTGAWTYVAADAPDASSG